MTIIWYGYQEFSLIHDYIINEDNKREAAHPPQHPQEGKTQEDSQGETQSNSRRCSPTHAHAPSTSRKSRTPQAQTQLLPQETGKESQ